MKTRPNRKNAVNPDAHSDPAPGSRTTKVYEIISGRCATEILQIPVAEIRYRATNMSYPPCWAVLDGHPCCLLIEIHESALVRGVMTQLELDFGESA